MKTSIHEKVSKEAAKRFGQILFGDFRGKNEKDTEYEARVFKKLKKWVRGEFSGKSRPKPLINYINALKQVKDEYPDVLEPKSTGMLYRVAYTKTIDIAKLDASMDDLDEIKDFFQNFPPISQFEEEGDRYIYEGGAYQPKRHFESWSLSLDSALAFAQEMTADRHPWIIVEAPAENDELLFNTDFLNQVADEFGYPKENEILRVSPEPIDNCNFMMPKHVYEPIAPILTQIEKYLGRV